MSVIYTTYDINLKHFLKERGYRYVLCGLGMSEPHRTFWVYERTDAFNKVLYEWLDNKPRNCK